jgi:sirohydrochlorin cobaltochelatase
MSDQNKTQRTLILFAHGARDARWREPFDVIAQRITEQRPDANVQIAFLEFMEPTLLQVCKTVYEQGIRQAVLIPLFLSQGGHVARDLPLLIEQACSQCPGLVIELTGAIGHDDGVGRAIAQACLARA